MFEARPVYAAFAVDRFDVVSANQLEQEDLDAAASQYRELSGVRASSMRIRSLPMSPNSNLVSARINPRRSAKSDACLYSATLASFNLVASSSPSSFVISAYVMFSSCPLSALVAGEKMGDMRR